MDELSQEVLIIAFLSLFIIMITGSIISLVLVYQKRQMKFFREKELLVNLHKNEVLQTRLEIQEQTFKNISQEIHDNIGQVLSLVKLNINTMDCTQGALMQEKINNSRILISKAIQDLRDLSKSLDAEYITDMGLSNAIRYELDIIGKTHRYDIHFKESGNSFTLNDKKQLVLFRIVQEALHNIIKHAEATEIKITLTYSEDYFNLQIVDNGKGYSDKEANKNGLGLKNMRIRAEMIGAQMTISGNPGVGTTINVSLLLPLQNAANE
ncbi:MAG TPA: ATP-binding protein [Hanamia sp.]|nr:ATP-binding protein [Hanamia sp.]